MIYTSHRDKLALEREGTQRATYYRPTPGSCTLHSGMVRTQTGQSEQEIPRSPCHMDIAQTPGKGAAGEREYLFGAKWDYSQDVLVIKRDKF